MEEEEEEEGVVHQMMWVFQWQQRDDLMVEQDLKQRIVIQELEYIVLFAFFTDSCLDQ